MEHKKIKWKQSALCMTVMALMAGVTFYILFKDQSVEALWLVIKNADIKFIVLGFGLMVLFVACEAAIIRLLAATWKRKVAWGRAMQYSFAGFYFSSITPSSTGGQPMQLYYMVRDGLGAAKSSFILLAITAMYQLGALLYGVIMVILKFRYIMGLGAALKVLIAFGIAVNGISACAILLMLFCRRPVELLAEKGIGLLARLHVVKRPETALLRAASMIEEYSEGGRYLRKYPLTALMAAAFTLLQLMCLYSASYCALLALGYGNISYFNFLMLQAIVSLAVSAVPLPGAVGASESSFLVMFRSFFTESQLLPFMTLGRGISFYGFLIISGLVVLYLQLHRSCFYYTGKDW